MGENGVTDERNTEKDTDRDRDRDFRAGLGLETDWNKGLEGYQGPSGFKMDGEGEDKQNNSPRKRR